VVPAPVATAVPVVSGVACAVGAGVAAGGRGQRQSSRGDDASGNEKNVMLESGHGAPWIGAVPLPIIVGISVLRFSV
jgi:hypothetical protein